MNEKPHDLRSRGLLAAALIALSAVLGCQETTTDPDIPPVVQVVYVPASGQLTAIRGEPLQFDASVVGVDSFHTVFTRGSEVLAESPQLTYVPAAIGADSILATVSYDDVTDQHLWRLQVTGPGLVMPPQPLDFQVIITDQVYITWTGEPGYDGPVPLSRIRAARSAARRGDRGELGHRDPAGRSGLLAGTDGVSGRATGEAAGPADRRAGRVRAAVT